MKNISVYQACVLAALLYVFHTLTNYRMHVKPLKRFQQKCLRSLVKILCQSYIPNTVVFEMSSIPSIELMILKYCLLWLRHEFRFEDGSIPKQIMSVEQRNGKRPISKRRNLYTDWVKYSLKNAGIEIKTWAEKTKDTELWRDEVMQTLKGFEERKLSLQQNIGCLSQPLTKKLSKDYLVCNICGRIFISKEYLTSNSNSHRLPDAGVFLVNFIRTVCRKVYINVSGLTEHF